MRKSTLLILCFFLSKLQAQNAGVLDTTFAVNGLSTIDRNTFESNIAFTIQPDNKVVAVGFTEEAGVSKLTVIRYLPDGMLDGTFASNGVFAGTYLQNINIAQAVTLQSDGKILVAGYGTNAQSANFYNDELLVLRFNTDGTPDNTFATNGVKILDLGYNERPVGIRTTSDGKILVAGSTFYSTASQLLVYRLNSDGNVDNSFGTNGYITTFFASSIWSYCYAMELQADGKILLAGEAAGLGNKYFGIIRLNANGSLDQTFSGDGKATNNISVKDDGAQAILLLPNGKILLGGYAVNAENKTEIALTQFNSNGSLDNTFGDAGDVIAQLGNDYSTIADLSLTALGNIIIAGTARRFPSHFDFFLAKYRPDGSLDESFGEQGITYTDYDGHFDGICDAQILQDGKILVAGMGVNTSNSISEFLLARYWFGENSGTEDLGELSVSAWAYPNPTTGHKMTLNYNLSEAAEVSLDLFSINGELLGALSKFKKAAGNQRESITLPSGLAAGAYLIGIQAGDKQTFIKIIVQ
ncbi:MAG: T9SS type A sorting domain-containing protein [Phycisphaerae bacterium]|nr:T9SS type A sorting domain-containing protein [Saprospiraceae bacterium]